MAHELPWQVKAIGQIGIPGLIALALLYVLMADRSAGSVQQHEEKALVNVQTEITRQHREQATMQRLQLRLLRQICLNGAKRDADRLECVDHRNDP